MPKAGEFTVCTLAGSHSFSLAGPSSAMTWPLPRVKNKEEGKSERIRKEESRIRKEGKRARKLS